MWGVTFSMIDTVIQKSLEAATEKSGDYYESGLLFCGVCHTAKQARISIPGSGEKIVGIACSCTEAQKAEADKALADNTFVLKISSMRREDGITDLSYGEILFADDDGANRKISDLCHRYVERWPAMAEDNIGILFYGPVGTGKTHFACAIANELLKQHVPTAITSFPRLLNLLQNAKDRQRLLDRLGAYKLLVIDDLGVERDTAYAAEQIFSVIDARGRSKLPTIITTNLTPQEMDDPPSMQYRRIFDRVKEMCPAVVLVDGESRRVQNAQRRKELARRLLL